VTRLVDLLGGEERLLLLVLVGHHETRELGGHALLADEERAEPPEVLLLLVLGQLGPLLLVALEVDRLRLPLLAFPQLVELLRVHQLERPVQVGVVRDGRDVALAGEVEKGGHGAILTVCLRRSPQGEKRSQWGFIQRLNANLTWCAFRGQRSFPVRHGRLHRGY
jgi:hypothetical protein